ncbi:MAG: hypothetical protein ACYS9X_18740 [Planctomycetota bacterium]|jgi:hypothetical protein
MDPTKLLAASSLALFLGCGRAPRSKAVAEQAPTPGNPAPASPSGKLERPRKEHDPREPAVINPKIAADMPECVLVWLSTEEQVHARPGQEIEVTFAVANGYRQDIFLITFPEDDPAGTMVFYEAETDFGTATSSELCYSSDDSWPTSPLVNWDGFKECALLIGWGWRGKSPYSVEGEKVSFTFRPESGITVTQKIRLPATAAARTSVIHFRLRIEYFVRGDATRYVGEFAKDVTVLYDE